jgi:hypothetical protein
VTIVRRYGTAERTFLPWADGMKVRKEKRMDARAEIGDFGLIFAHTHLTPPRNAPFFKPGALFRVPLFRLSGSVFFAQGGGAFSSFSNLTCPPGAANARSLPNPPAIPQNKREAPLFAAFPFSTGGQ